MTEFRNSGLPNDPAVFKAFLTYRDNIKTMPEAVRTDQAPLKAARMLSQHTNDNSPVMLALLGLMPQTTWGVVKKRFGTDIAAQLEESRLHVATGYAYLADASPAVKQLTMAGALVAFERVEQAAEDMENHLRNIRVTGEMPIGFEVPPVMITDIYAKIGRSCAGTSGAPALEAFYAEKFESMKEAQTRMIAGMAEVGIFIQGLPPGEAPAELRYPAFEETGLMDTPKIRAAYDLIATHTRVAPEDFEGALQAGKVLSTLSPTKNPTVIAAALVDIGLRQLGPYDGAFLHKKLDWDVMEILNVATVYNITHPQQVLDAPVEFRQIALANAAVIMDDARKGGEDFLNLLAQNPEYPKGAIMQSLLTLKRLSVTTQQLYTPSLGTTDMPELDNFFANKLTQLNTFISQNMPERKAPAPKPSGPKPKPGDGPAP